MTDHKAPRRAPAPFAAALADGEDARVHAEFDANGDLDTGSIALAKGVSLRATQGGMRLVIPMLPDTLVAALTGRHVSAVVEHPWLSDPRLVMKRVDGDDDRLSIAIAAAPAVLSAE